MSFSAESWEKTWAGLGTTPPPGLRENLLDRYREPGRSYHTLQHLGECFATFSRIRHLACRPEEIAIALWFHDAIHDPHRSDCEEASAELAERSLAAAGVPVEAIARVAGHILATKHETPPRDGDTRLLVDADLSVLGASGSRFAEYRRQIRSEYAFVPEGEFVERRNRLFQAILARPRIYSTPDCHSRFEVRARANMQRAIASGRP